jgi:4-alpha-glucanotransferase
MKLPARAAGVLLHPTSLPGPHGLGDLGPSAYHFVDWLHGAGQTVWQWLPTTPPDGTGSPYQSPSAFAGSPLLVALEPLIERGWLTNLTLPEGGWPNGRADFDAVAPWRLAALRSAATGFAEHASTTERTELRDWAASQQRWLDDYTLFMALQTRHGGAPWWQWDGPLRRRDAAALVAAREALADEITFWTFVQWCFDSQLAALKAYANARGVALMGDLPIFVAHHSADCWARPELFHLDAQDQPTLVAGAPPDPLGPEGQHWGNPLYRWDRMAADGYAWWIARLQRAMQLADLFRIDHFRGFAAYWAIPAESPNALAGAWQPGPGLALFQALHTALGELPIVAEDLGLITPDVAQLLADCGYPGMRVLLFAFGGDATHSYLPHHHVPGTVAYTGTHDTDTARGWWNAASAAERRFAASYLPASEHDIHWGLVRAACNSVAKLAIFPLQDVLGLGSEHRMNIPGTSTGNWGWRFDWSMVGPEPGRVLGLITAASGRGPFELLGR